MPKASKDTADKVEDYGVASETSSEVDGYTVQFVSIKETMSLAPMLATLPGGHCVCPHWGYLFAGEMTVSYGDHTETYHAGDAFYMSPGHVPESKGGSEFVLFSPTDELAATDAAIRAGMQAS